MIKCLRSGFVGDFFFFWKESSLEASMTFQHQSNTSGSSIKCQESRHIELSEFSVIEAQSRVRYNSTLYSNDDKNKPMTSLPTTIPHCETRDTQLFTALILAPCHLASTNDVWHICSISHLLDNFNPWVRTVNFDLQVQSVPRSTFLRLLHCILEVVP